MYQQSCKEAAGTYSVTNLNPLYTDSLVAAAIVRHEMDYETERSPLMMHRELNEIRGDAAARYRQYELEQGRLAKQRAQDAKDIEMFKSWQRGKALVEAQEKDSKRA